MRYLVVVLILLIRQNIAIAQSIIIIPENISEKKATIFSLSGEKATFIDSINSNADDEFRFSLANRHSGIYRLTFNQNAWLDYIYDNEDVEIETDANNILDSLNVIKSESNKIYYKFIRLNKDYKRKTNSDQGRLS